jgi:hypothetical protein
MPQTGHFILYSTVRPQVTAGRYVLVSEQTGTPFNVAPENTHVTVAAPRYVMPTDQIISTFPPANAEGAFSDRLPQIVLKRRTLPWERNPVEPPPTPPPAPPPPPWLALVVVAEGEAQLSSATPVGQCVTPGKTLPDAADKDVEQGLYLAVTETVVKKIFPCEQDLELLVHVRQVDINDTELANGDDDGWMAVVLANRLPVFNQANGKPVRYMACLLNLERQLDALPPPDPPEDHFRFELAQDWAVLAALDNDIGVDPRVMGSVDLGNIVLPTPGGLMQAQPPGAAAAPQAASAVRGSARVGVSLNGAGSMDEASAAGQWTSVTERVTKAASDPDAKRLVRDTMALGFRFPIEIFAVEKVYRFPVLAHWSFTTNEGATFETLMRDIDIGLLGTVPEPAAGAPPAPAGPEVVQTGHIGLDHRTRRGDTVRSWYRGPLVPFPTDRDPVDGSRPLLAHSADQIRRVVPDGREDLSLAAAFEIGRLLGLSQLSVVSALLRFRGEQFGAARIREILKRATPFELPNLFDQRIDLGRFVALQVIGNLANNTTQMLGPRRPVADPGRAIVVEGDLDAVIAGGLGLDLEAIRQKGEEVGILAAVMQAQVPLANPEGNVKIDRTAVTNLRGALSTELEKVLDVAMPRLQHFAARPGRGRRRALAAMVGGRDALDELLERADTLDDTEED